MEPDEVFDLSGTMVGQAGVECNVDVILVVARIGNDIVANPQCELSVDDLHVHRTRDCLSRMSRPVIPRLLTGPRCYPQAYVRLIAFRDAVSTTGPTRRCGETNDQIFGSAAIEYKIPSQRRAIGVQQLGLPSLRHSFKLDDKRVAVVACILYRDVKISGS